MAALYLHIGYPKTGTTALQRQYFPQLRDYDFDYSGNDDPANAENARTFASHTRQANEHHRPHNVMTRNTLISHEGIIADCLKDLESNGRFRPQPVAGLAERCKQAAALYLPDAIRIIVSFRKQGELSHAVFAQSFAHYFSRTKDLKTYAAYARHILDDDEIAAAYDFHSVATDFIGVFGKDNVLVLFYEDLVADPENYLGSLSRFIGCRMPSTLMPDNVRLTADGRFTQPTTLYEDLAAFTTRRLPWLRPGLGKHLRFLHRLPGRRSRVIARDHALEQRVTAHYQASNRRLGELVNRDLSVLGYY